MQIFLRRFCIIYCTQCPDMTHTDQHIKLDGYLYTTERMHNDFSSVSLHLYILDPLHQIPDYKKVCIHIDKY